MSEMGLFVIVFNGWKPLTSIAGSSTSDAAVVLNASLHTFSILISVLLGLDLFNWASSFQSYMVYLFSIFVSEDK